MRCYRPSRLNQFLLAAVLWSLSCPDIGAAGGPSDWLTLPSTYSHDPETGARVVQYAPNPAPAAPIDPTFRSSGYTHLRSTLAYGQSADNYHQVETWGAPVRPYGEWRFPYRPYSTPYPNWGPPYAGFNLGLGFGAPYANRPLPGYGGGRGRLPRGAPDGGPDNGGGDMLPGNGDDRPDRPTPPQYPPRRFPPVAPPPASPFNPYPAGPGSPYPVAPYYDGYYPPYRD